MTCRMLFVSLKRAKGNFSRVEREKSRNFLFRMSTQKAHYSEQYSEKNVQIQVVL